MNPFERRLLHLCNILVGGTGLLYAAMVYLMHNDDPYAVVNHPAQPHVQHLHVLGAPLLIFAVALVWQNHIWKRFHNGTELRRRAGIVLLLAFAPMVMSGYFLQISVEEGWRSAWSLLHTLSGIVWAVFYAAHFVLRKPRAAA